MKHLIFWLFLVSISFGQTQNLLDPLNSTSKRLGANGTFTGYAVDNIGNQKYSTIISTVVTDKVSATGGFKFQISADSINWRTSDSISVSANSIGTLATTPKLRYYRIKYVNGTDSILQSSFTIQTAKYPIASVSTNATLSGSVDATLVGTNDVGITSNSTGSLARAISDSLWDGGGIPILIYGRDNMLQTPDALDTTSHMPVFLDIRLFRNNQLIDTLAARIARKSAGAANTYSHNDTTVVDVNNLIDTTSDASYFTTFMPDGNHKWECVAVTDTITNGRTDTLVFKAYSTLLGAYRSQLIGFTDVKTGNLLADSTLIVTSTIAKEYMVSVPYPIKSMQIGFPNAYPQKSGNKFIKRGFRVMWIGKKD